LTPHDSGSLVAPAATNDADGPSSLVAPASIPCVAGTAMPQLHIIGEEKAGTSSLLASLLSAAPNTTSDACWKPSTFSITSECHSYDSLCGWSDARTRQPTLEWLIGSCPAEPTALERRLLLDQNPDGYQYRYQCGATPPGLKLLVDKTPTNSRLFGLPSFLSAVYGARSAAAVRVVFLCREPLSRMYAAYWFYRSVTGRAASPHRKDSASKRVVSNDFLSAPSTYCSMLLDSLPPTYSALVANGTHSLCARAYGYDFFYRSLSALQLKPWLDEFASGQFLLLPFGWAMSQQADALRLIGALVEPVVGSLGANLSQAQQAGVQANNDSYPAINTTLDAATQAALRERYFEPDTRVLSALIASRGLTLGGAAEQACATEAACYQALTGLW